MADSRFGLSSPVEEHCSNRRSVRKFYKETEIYIYMQCSSENDCKVTNQAVNLKNREVHFIVDWTRRSSEAIPLISRALIWESGIQYT